MGCECFGNGTQAFKVKHGDEFGLPMLPNNGLRRFWECSKAFRMKHAQQRGKNVWGRVPKNEGVWTANAFRQWAGKGGKNLGMGQSFQNCSTGKGEIVAPSR
jgi:hypothetical protein